MPTKDINTKSMHIGIPLCVTSAGHTMFHSFPMLHAEGSALERGPTDSAIVEDCISHVNGSAVPWMYMQLWSAKPA